MSLLIQFAGARSKPKPIALKAARKIASGTRRSCQEIWMSYINKSGMSTKELITVVQMVEPTVEYEKMILGK